MPHRARRDPIPPADTDADTAFNKMAQTVRRTTALEAKLAEGVKVRREGLITGRAQRRAQGGSQKHRRRSHHQWPARRLRRDLP